MKALAAAALVSATITASASTTQKASAHAPASAPAQLIYLSCDVPAGGNTPQTHYAATHFDFTLDEKNGTISYYVKEAGAANVETAIFGPDSITWVRDVGGIAHTTRTISRVDLSFVTLIDIAGTVSRRPGQCSLVDASKRKF
jgi:hypothetical protein